MRYVRAMSLDTVSTVALPREVVVQTVEALRTFGQDGCEGLVLWLGDVYPAFAQVRVPFVPPQRAIKNETGVGYFVEEGTLFALNKFLAERRMRLIAQVHSHPTDAHHSEMDDRYAIVTSDGGFSLVVPDFGFGVADVREWASYRLRDGTWLEMNPTEVLTTFLFT